MMDSSESINELEKTSELPSVELNIGENIVIDENTEILTYNNDSNIQLEFFDVKNLSHNDLIITSSGNNLEEENFKLKKELSIIQEKFSILHSQVQNQSKLIELLVRLDMLNSDQDPDKKELEDLHKKITLCYNLVEECSVKYNELCNEKRRLLIVNDSEPEKRSAIWDHFTVTSVSEGQKNAECNYCGKSYNYKNLSANKCRDHIYERCPKAPYSIKSEKKPRFENTSKPKYTVWNYFQNIEKDGKTIINCMYCGTEYMSRNATKCREHLAFKCTKIPTDVREKMRSTFSQDYINALNSNKRSSIWEHFSIVEDEDKTVIQCIYCCMNYANKNATKCREHLMDRCDKIPLGIRHKINNSFSQSPLKTWTQIKIPIWTHFSIINSEDKKEYKCNYCKKIYTSKNVTKFRTHLLFKCSLIPDSVKSFLNIEVTRSANKSTSDGEFIREDDDDDTMEQDSEQKLIESNVLIFDETMDNMNEIDNTDDGDDTENKKTKKLKTIKAEISDDTEEEMNMESS